jgi:hypothetical protein
VDLEPSDENPVQRADQQADHHDAEEHQGRRDPGVERQDDEGRRQAVDGSHGEVELAGDHQDGYADRDDSDRCRAQQNIGRHPVGVEKGSDEGEQQVDGDGSDHDARFRARHDLLQERFRRPLAGDRSFCRA